MGWADVATFGLNKLFSAGDKAIDVVYIHKAVNRLKAEVNAASQDGQITTAEWCKILAHFIELVAVARQGVRE